MDEKTKKIIKERFDSLPKSIQEVILSSNYVNTLTEIGKQYQVNIEQLGILERETTLTMMGLTPTKDFENELGNELKIDKVKVSQVVKDINEKIFFRIRELLKLMNTPVGEEPSIEEELPEKIESTNQKTKSPIPTTIWPKKEAPAELHPIFAQKLTGSFQTPYATTEHTLENLSGTKELPSGKKINTPQSTSYPPSKDPYRLSPDE